jgi:hypothetical protein
VSNALALRIVPSEASAMRQRAVPLSLHLENVVALDERLAIVDREDVTEASAEHLQLRQLLSNRLSEQRAHLLVVRCPVANAVDHASQRRSSSHSLQWCDRTL